MPIPTEYQMATEHFKAFLADAQEFSDLGTINQTYTMVQGVLQVFRRRITVKDSILFANALPAILRAIYVTDWDIDEPVQPFGSREEMTKEVQHLRRHHNFAPEHAIEAVVRAVRKHVNEQAFDRVLDRLPEEARAFWVV